MELGDKIRKNSSDHGILSYLDIEQSAIALFNSQINV